MVTLSQAKENNMAQVNFLTPQNIGVQRIKLLTLIPKGAIVHCMMSLSSVKATSLTVPLILVYTYPIFHFSVISTHLSKTILFKHHLTPKNLIKILFFTDKYIKSFSFLSDYC